MRKPNIHDEFVTPSLYRYVRHPLYVDWFVTLWATPSMSVGHLPFSAVRTVYVLIAVPHEEQDLLDAFGDCYARYPSTTPMFFPRLRRPIVSDRKLRAA